MPLPALPTASSSTCLPPSPSGGTSGSTLGGSLVTPPLDWILSPYLTAPDSCWESTSELAKLGYSALQASRLWRLRPLPSLILSLCIQVSTGPALRERSLVWTHALEGEPSRYSYHWLISVSTAIAEGQVYLPFVAQDP